MQSVFPSTRYSILVLFLIALSPQQIMHASIGEAYDFISDTGVKKNIGGYIKAEYYYDSRQVTAFSVDQFLLYPKKKEYDRCCEDLNKRAEGHFVAIESRLSFSFSGTKVRCADLSGLIEGDFWGASNINFNAAFDNGFEIPNIFRLRLAAIFLDWPCINLTMGQHWHPMTIEECYPQTISFNNGTPMDPYSRAPLIKIDYKKDSLHIIAGATFELDLASSGPQGENPVYMARGLVPNFDVGFKKFFGAHALGALIDYKRIVPRIRTNKCFAVVEPLSSGTLVAWLALNWPDKFAWHSKIAYCQNGTDYGVIGGYGTHSIDPDTDKRTYTNIDALAFWWDFIVCPGKEVEPGLFIGAVKNLGSLKSILPNCLDECCDVIDRRIFGFGTDIDTVFRISPRMRWRMSKELTIAAELEYTRAAYGTITSSGKVINTTPVGNIRGLCAAYYLF